VHPYPNGAPILAVTDASAFRSVVAAEDERILIALDDRNRQATLRLVLSATEEIRRRGTKVSVIVVSDGLEPVDADLSQIGFLEGWAAPLLPAAAGVADVVLSFDERSADTRAIGVNVVQVPDDCEVQRLVSVIMEVFSPKPPAALKERPPTQVHAARSKARKYVLANDWGIGDELLLSAVAREIVRTHPDVAVWIKSRFGFRFPSYVEQSDPPDEAVLVETIYQNPALYGPESHSPFPGHLVEQMLDKFALDTGHEVKAKDVRPELVFRAPHRREERTVIVHSRPGPRLPSKDWGLSRWERLSELLNANGVHLRQVGGRDEPLLPGAEDCRGTPVSELPELCARATAVVCVAGLLMHLAEATRTPAVVIYGGRETPAIDGYPDQIHLGSGPLPCRGRWGCHLGAEVHCSHRMECMDGITPELVAAEVLGVISGEAQ
jgi:hypothetical protein